MTVESHLARGELKMEPIRAGFGRGLVAAAENNPNIVGLCADLTESTHMHLFANKFPQRFVQVGVAEQNLVTAAAGLAAVGKMPFASSYAAFSPGRNWEQIRTTIALNNQPVKIIGSHAGLYTGADGATHQMLEDLPLMRAMPNMIVLAPADSREAEKATLAMALDKRPSYMRVTREATAVFTTEKTPFAIGKAYVWRIGSQISLIATGTMTYQSLLAARLLEKEGISAEVVHVPTLKPLDTKTILASCVKTGRVISVEEGQINGGLGAAIAETLSENYPLPLKRLGVNDKFGESGEPEELLEAHGLTAQQITAATKIFLRGEK